MFNWDRSKFNLVENAAAPLRKLISDALTKEYGVENVEQIFENMPVEEAQRRVDKLEKDHKTYDDRLTAFHWTPDPARALQALYRRAGRNPRARSVK